MKVMPAAAQAEAETARINAWFDAKYEEELGFSPMTRTSPSGICL